MHIMDCPTTVNITSNKQFQYCKQKSSEKHACVSKCQFVGFTMLVSLNCLLFEIMAKYITYSKRKMHEKK